jgi:hypothetical protein
MTWVEMCVVFILEMVCGRGVAGPNSFEDRENEDLGVVAP